MFKGENVIMRESRWKPIPVVLFVLSILCFESALLLFVFPESFIKVAQNPLYVANEVVKVLFLLGIILLAVAIEQFLCVNNLYVYLVTLLIWLILCLIVAFSVGLFGGALWINWLLMISAGACGIYLLILVIKK